MSSTGMRGSWVVVSSLVARISIGAFVGLAALPACVVDAQAVDSDEGATTAAEPAAVTTLTESSYVSAAVLDVLAASPSNASMRGKTWNVSHDNRLAGDWILKTPVQPMFGHAVAELVVPAACTSNCDPDFQLQRCAAQSDCTGGGTCKPVAATVRTPGGAPTSLCVGHSDALIDEMYRVMASGEKFVDVTSLLPPDGRYLAAMRNAITFQSRKASPPKMRLLFGDFPLTGVVNTTTLLQTLSRDVAASSPIRVAVGAFRSSDLPASWNHSKIIAVDGKTAIVGGHNLWTQHYQDKDPVADLSMRVEGSAAVDGHKFANVLWDYTCSHMTWLTWTTWSVWANQLENGAITSHCPARFDLAGAAGPPGATVISVGRLGTGIQTNGNQADAARVAMMASARTTIRLSQQDIGPAKAPLFGIPVGSWPDAEIGALADALTRGVQVYVVLSDNGAVAGGLSSTYASYSNGWSLADVGHYLQSYMQARAGYPHDAALRALLCDKLHLAQLRYGADASWPDGALFANHAKTISVDQQAFYIGSQNVYPAGLQEFGFIVDDSTATAQYLAGYWNGVWASSSTTAISGNGVASCGL